MGEQELVKKEEDEEEEKIKVDLTELDKGIKKKIGPRELKTIIFYRVDKKYNWLKVAKAVGTKYKIKVTPKQVHDAYNTGVAKATILSDQGHRLFNKQIKEMEERFDDIWSTVDRLHQAAKNLLDEYEATSKSDMETYIKFMKTAPTILKITQEIKSQIEFLREQQEKIVLEQKNYVYSPIQIMTKVNEYIKVVLRNRPDLLEDFKKLIETQDS